MSHWKDLLETEARGGRYLPWKEVARVTGLSRTTAWRLQKRDDFPAPYVISPGRVGYGEDEVEAWRVSRSLRSGAVRSKAAHRTRSAAPPQTSAGSAMAVDPPPRPATPHDPAPSPSRSTPPPSDAGAMSRSTALPGPAPPSGRRPRRRSQHAQAIAQQILFDF